MKGQLYVCKHHEHHTMEQSVADIAVHAMGDYLHLIDTNLHHCNGIFHLSLNLSPLYTVEPSTLFP